MHLEVHVIDSMLDKISQFLMQIKFINITMMMLMRVCAIKLTGCKGVAVGSVGLGRALVWLSDFRKTRVRCLARACATFASRPQATESGSIHLSRKSKGIPLN